MLATRPSDGGACGGSSACCSSPVSGAGRPSGSLTLPPTFSAAPVRLATGELALHATDVSSDGFAVPWGHVRSFASRLSINESLGNGYNWQVEQWPYLVLDYYGNVVVQGKANTATWFSKVNGAYAAAFGVRQTLVKDAEAGVYRLYELDGSYTEFDDFTGMFRRQLDAAGNKIDVKAMCDNAYNFTEVEREYGSDPKPCHC